MLGIKDQQPLIINQLMIGPFKELKSARFECKDRRLKNLICFNKPSGAG